MRIGDRCFVHGYVDEIHKDTIIIRNKGGYFGTDPGEVIVANNTAHPNVSDCVSRHAAIDAVKCAVIKDEQQYAEDALKALPSAQLKIIYCGDCNYKDDGIDEDGIQFLKCLHPRSYGDTRINDFCSWAERRTDGSD